MVSLVPYENNQINRLSLPNEIKSIISDYADLSNEVAVVMGMFSICIYDINSKKLIKRINSFQMHHMSVSRCYNFVAASDETRVCIWNLKTSELLETIYIEFNPIYDKERDGQHCMVRSLRNGEPVHTFTNNNELLIANKNQIKSYYYDGTTWNEKKSYEIPHVSHIVCIASHPSQNVFACGTLNGDVYIFNNDSIIHIFTTRQLLMRSDNYPEISNLAFNDNILFVSCMGRNSLLFNINTTEKIRVEQPVVEIPGSYFNIINFMLLPCKTKFIGTFNGYTFIWDAITGKPIKQLNLRNLVRNSALTSDGTKIISYGVFHDCLIVENID